MRACLCVRACVSTSLFLARNLGCPIWVRHSRRKNSATHSYQCDRYFPVSKQWYGWQCSGLFTCAQMLMHAIAHGGRTNTVRESALKVDSGRQIPGGLEPVSVLLLAYHTDALPTEPSPLNVSLCRVHAPTHSRQS